MKNDEKKIQEKEKEVEASEVTFVVVSGINFPHLSRKYLMRLLTDVVREHNASFVIIAGHTMAGEYLEKELVYRIAQEKAAIKEANLTAKRGQRITFTEKDKAQLGQDFVAEQTSALNEFLPRLEVNGRQVNYHIVLAEKIYDRSIGVNVLHKLREIRQDIRIFDDPESKIPINLPGVDDPRVMVPTRMPWHYKNITGLMQRLIDAFIPRTLSPRPPFIIAGCTGTGAFIPYYEGVPAFSVPDLRKIDQRKSTEQMVGCLVINVKITEGKTKLRARFYDWRVALFNERKYAIANLTSSKEDRMILNALKPSTASPKTILFRTNYYQRNRNNRNNRNNRKNHQSFNEAGLKERLDNLLKQELVVYDTKSNRYGLNPKIMEKADVTLQEFLDGHRTVNVLAGSCFHIGALKTLYFTLLEDLWRQAVDVDIIVINGDVIQGIYHSYEYSGELLPIANGYDKQNILAAHLFEKGVVWPVFKERFKKNKEKGKSALELLRECLLKIIMNLGNHDRWETHNKNAIPLSLFEATFKNLVLIDILRFCEEQKLKVSVSEAQELIEEKFIRVGENKEVIIQGIRIGIKHSHKSRTVTKSQRPQEAAGWFEKQKFLKLRDVALVLNANFHEAAAVHIGMWGRTIFSVMTGAFLKDTQFEQDRDKVVDYGTAKILMGVDKSQRILFTQVDFDDTMNQKDRAFVLADKITDQDVLKRCSEIIKATSNLLWRSA